MGNSFGNDKYDNTINSNTNNNNSNKINNLGNPKPNIEKANKVKENKVKANKVKVNKVNNIDKVDKSNNVTNDNTPHKLGQRPNNIKTFEENLKKKKEEEEKIRKEKKLKRELDNKKNTITSLNNDNKLIKNENNNINNNNNNIMNKNKIPKLDFENDEENKFIDSDGNNDEYLNNINLMDDEYLNNINLMDDEEFIRQPLPTKIDCLTGNEEINKEFEKFKKEILSDNSIDKDMQEIIIQSRFEFIKNHEKKIQENTEKIIRVGLIAPLKIKLKDKNFTKISLENIEKIISLIDKWVDMKIQLIKLETDLLYQLFELIDIMYDEKKITDVQKIKNIFIPSNSNEYIELVEIMEIVKTQSILEEKNRIERELEAKRIEKENYDKQQELEKIKLQEIEVRNEKVKLLIYNLNKMAGFDSGIKNLKDSLNEPIKKYCSVDTEFVIVDKIIYNDTIKFINSIRISLQDKESIISLCKCL
jgi:hypothetical protein